MNIEALQKRKVKVPARRSGAGSGRGGKKRRPRRARTFVQREQVLAIVSALGTLENTPQGPLAFIRVGTRTLLEHTLERTFKCAASIAVVVPEEGMAAARALLGDSVTLVASNTFEIGALLPLLTSANAPYILVHDVRYPFAWPKLMMGVLMGALDSGTAVTVSRAPGTVAEIRENVLVPADLTASHVHVHTPQGYLSETLTAIAATARGRILDLDQAWRLAHEHGDSVATVQNVPINIRMGTALDLELARTVVLPKIEKRRGSRAAKGPTKPGRPE